MNDILKCLPEDSWFRDFVECFPLAEPPTSYLLFSCMACLGGALGRRVRFDLDVHKVYPLLNLLLIGPSGIGKSTAMRDIACNYLLPALPDDLRPQLLTGRSTKEAIHQDILVNAKSIILASEFANLFSKEKYNEGLVAYITDLLDLAPARVRTKSAGNLIVQKPECCVLGGSTQIWLQEMLPNNSGEGGFLPRFLIVKETYKRQRIADPLSRLTDTERKELATRRENALYNFAKLVRIAEGEMKFADYEARDAFTVWYETATPESGALSPFFARASVHVLRLALLIAVSCGRDEIKAEDVEAAIDLYQYTSKRLSEVVIPLSQSGKNYTKLLEMIGNLAMSGTEIRRSMRNYMGSQDCDRLLGDLVRDKELVLDEGMYRRPQH